jgi:5-methylcytosine-specific restriction endonuclease McrA
LAAKGSAFRAEGNPALRTSCAKCGKSIPTEVGHAHPLDEAFHRETWGLVGHLAGRRSVFATCDVCHEAGWRPPGFVGIG